MSHPVWVRGLKLSTTRDSLIVVTVAPRVGAWIETFDQLGHLGYFQSHPVWVRGLKLCFHGVSASCR